MKTLRAIAVVLGVLGAGLVLSPPARAATLWTVTDLRPLSGDSVAQVVDLNSTGASAGASAGVHARPVKWDKFGNPTALQSTVGCDGYATDINDAGVVVGFTSCPSTGLEGYLWRADGIALYLGSALIPTAVDENGIVAGYRTTETGTQAVVRWPGHDDGEAIPLPTAGAPKSVPASLTSFGYLVGELDDLGSGLPNRLAVGWYGDQVFPLVATGYPTWAVDVNDAGHALVQAATGQGDRAYIVNPGGKTTALESVGNDDAVTDINNADIVVGARDIASGGNGSDSGPVFVGLFYAFGGSVRLDTIVSAENKALFKLERPAAVNDSAWVAGTSSNGKAWLLKPPA